MVEAKLLSVFLCHASEDKEKVEKFHDHLTKDGVDSWLDSEKIKPGENWRMVIEKAVAEAHVVIVFLSGNSTSKEGFVQREIKIALDLADEKPEGTIFIIPARLEECSVPQRLKDFQWVDLFREGGYEKMFKSLKERADKLNIALRQAELYFSNYRAIFPDIEKLARTHPKDSLISIKEVAVAGVYTWELWGNLAARLLSELPSVNFSLESLIIHPERLTEFSKDQVDWAAWTMRRMQENRQLKNILSKQFGERVIIETRLSENLPERIGILINDEHLFYSDVDYNEHEGTTRLTAGANTFSYHPYNSQQAATDIKRFANRFNYFWKKSTSLEE